MRLRTSDLQKASTGEISVPWQIIQVGIFRWQVSSVDPKDGSWFLVGRAYTRHGALQRLSSHMADVATTPRTTATA